MLDRFLSTLSLQLSLLEIINKPQLALFIATVSSCCGNYNLRVDDLSSIRLRIDERSLGNSIVEVLNVGVVLHCSQVYVLNHNRFSGCSKQFCLTWGGDA